MTTCKHCNFSGMRVRESQSFAIWKNEDGHQYCRNCGKSRKDPKLNPKSGMGHQQAMIIGDAPDDWYGI